MSFNGSGTFVINSAGQPVVANTVISATTFNALTADLANGLTTCITKDGQTTPTANIPMGGFKITNLATGTAATDAATVAQIQSNGAALVTVTGTDTLTGSLTPALVAYVTGAVYYFVAPAANTGAVTLNIDTLGAKNVTRDGTTALVAGDIVSGEMVAVVYDGTRFQLISPVNSFTNLNVSGTLTVAGTATLNGNVAIGDAAADTINFKSSGWTLTNNVSVIGTWADIGTITTADINGGTIDGTTIGGGTAAAGTFTTATATTGNITTVNATTVDSTNLEVTNLKAKDGTAAGSIADSTGVVTLNSLNATTVNIDGGTIDATTIGGSSPAAGTFSNLIATNLSAASANFGVAVIGTFSATTLELTNLEVTNIKAEDGSPAMTITNVTGKVNIPTASIASANAAVALITTGTVTNLVSSDASIGSAAIVNAAVTNLTATSASIASMNAGVALFTTATVTNFTATGASIASTNAGTAVITNLTATGASVASMNVGVALLTTATVTTLNATGASIASANIGNLQFTAASIASINAGVAVITNLTATGASIASANVGTAVITTGTVTNLTSTSASIASANAAVALVTTGTVTNLTSTSASIASANLGTAVVTTGTVTNLTATGASIASANVGTAVITAATVTGASIASMNAGVALLTTATVTNLTATSASIASANVGTLALTRLDVAAVSVASANAGVAVITTGTVTNLTSTSASIASMNAGVALLTTATVTNLTATGASVASANVGTAVVTGLTVTGASIASVNAGVAVLSGNLTLNGGTANGVLYLNGSKVATSGSALVFDGTNLGVGAASPAYPLQVRRAGGAGSLGVTVDSVGAISRAIQYYAVGDTTSVATGHVWYYRPATATDTLGMALNGDGNLGIGTASPSDKLHVVGLARINTGTYAAGYGLTFQANAETSRTYQMGMVTGGNFAIYDSTAAEQRVVLDTSGNLGLGVTPSLWGAGSQAMQNGGGSLFQYNNDRVFIGQNTYIDTSFADKFIGNGYATRYRQYQGTHAFFVSTASNSSGAGALASFTQAMTLDASGNLSAGTTSIASSGQSNGITSGSVVAVKGALNANTTSAGIFEFNSNKVSIRAYGATAGTGLIAFSTGGGGGSADTERGRFTAEGYFKASNNGTYAGSTASYHELYSSASSDWIGYFTQATATSPNGIIIQYTAAAPNGTGNTFLYCQDNVAVRATIRSNGGIANYSANDVNLSDERTKKDIAPLGSMWDKFKAIEIVTFKYKDQTHEDNNIGVIAQQVESVAPEFVDVDGWGETPEDGVPLKSIYTADMYHAAIKALQEAMARIESLEADMAALKGAK